MEEGGGAVEELQIWTHIYKRIDNSSSSSSSSTLSSLLRGRDFPAFSEWIFLALAVFILIVWAVIMSFHFIAIVNGRCRLHKKRALTAHHAEAELPGVSILKPLCSASDPNLFQNLDTFFTLDYPKFEILFCIQDDDSDGKLKMYVESLRNKHPSVECQAYYGGESVGVNPKINNMEPAFKASKYDLILVSDAGIRMKEDTLTDMVASMKEKVGLVHQMPFACDRSGIPATLEKVFFGTHHARVYLTANVFGFNCATGMSSLMRKKVLEKLGGLKTFGHYLAEDYFIAQAFLREGYKIDISSQPAQQSPGDTSVASFQSRISRWVKLRVAMCPWLLLFEPLSECMTLGLASAWSVYYLFRISPSSFFLVHVLVWFLMDWLLLGVVQNGSLPFNKFEFAVMWLFREVSSPCIFLEANYNPAIRWRSKRFRLKWGGIAETETEIPDKIKV